MKLSNLKTSLIILNLFTLSFFACQNNNACQDPIDTADIEVKIEITRLEQEIFQLKTKKEITQFLDKYPDFSEIYLQRSRRPHDSVLVNLISYMVNEPHQDTLYQDVQKKYENIESIKQEFIDAFKHIKYYYPDFKIPKIYTITTGLKSFFGTDLFVNQDMIVISLDFFMGKDARYRPPTEEFPDYIWRRYHAKAIVPTAMLGISNQYNQTDFEDKTTVAEMLYFGKSYHFIKAMMPCIPDSTLFGYTQEELNNVEDENNRDYIWRYLLDKKVLFSTNHLVKNNFLNESPYIAEINKACPGRIGRWFGYRIIQKYMKRNPKVNFTELMATTKTRELFNQSGYRGD